jgi:hypothetical protein
MYLTSRHHWSEQHKTLPFTAGESASLAVRYSYFNYKKKNTKIFS